MAPMEVSWLFLVKMQPLPATSWLPTVPTVPPYRSVNGIGYASKNYLKWQENQLAIQCTIDTMDYFEQLQICEETRAGSPNHSGDIMNYKIVFLNIYNCMYKTLFCKSSHI